MKRSLLRAFCGGSTALLVLGCLGGHVQASPARPSACAGLDTQHKALGNAALQAGRWMGPAHVVKHLGRVTQKRAVGVELFVAARPGLNAPWLRRAAECRIEEDVASGNVDSPFGVAGTHVEVRAADTGYVVRIIASDGEVVDQLLGRLDG